MNFIKWLYVSNSIVRTKNSFQAESALERMSQNNNYLFDEQEFAL